MSKYNTHNSTTFKTPALTRVEVEAKKKVFSYRGDCLIKIGQFGDFTFQKMRFSEKIMVYGLVWSWEYDHDILTNEAIRVQSNKRDIYTAMTYAECTESFKFINRDEEANFKKLFETHTA